MKLERFCVELESHDVASEMVTCIEIEGGSPFMVMNFPRRTPRDKLQAVADAINAALAAAREVEGLARD